MDNSAKKLFPALGLGIIAVFGLLVYIVIASRTQTPSLMQEVVPAVKPTSSLPTRTPEEKKVIEEVKDYIIQIANSSFSPKEITVKAYDQVFWENKDSKTHSVRGENWGGIPILKGNRYMHSFDKLGTYSYSLGEDPLVKGTVVVE